MTETTVNADPAELAKFSELAHRWWDPESEFRPLHQINPLRLDWIQSHLPLAGKRVLDVGCGGGILADSMARKGAAGAGHRPGHQGPAGRAAARPGGGHAQRRLPRSQCRGAGRRAARHASTPSPAWRCSSTCPTRARWCAPAASWSSRAAGCSSPRSTATPSPSCSPSSAPSTCSTCCPGARTNT